MDDTPDRKTATDTMADLKAAQLARVAEISATCPRCGFCPTCGRGASPAPWHPYPWYPSPWPGYYGPVYTTPRWTVTSSGTLTTVDLLRTCTT